MEKLYAKSAPDWTPLKNHLLHVSYAAKKFANYLKKDELLAYHGAILHDIGKVHPVFQKRLKGNVSTRKVFRHEIASLFFLSAFPKSEHSALIEMVVGHHKSIKKDVGDKGLLDLEEGYEYEDYHLGEWNLWSPQAFNLLKELGVDCIPFDEDEARENLIDVIDYCQKRSKERNYSEWRGVLMGADHYASSLINETQSQLDRAFKQPDISFFNRRDKLYPLSLKSTISDKKHTIVVACTGAGKTDFLFKRTKGRVFYTLPFQASINAMFKRLAKDLESTNPDLDIRVLHSASMVVKREGKSSEEEVVLQSLFGSSIKVLTPHQLASIAFGMKGYEALLLDLKGCDIILDEIHTYTGVSQAIVLKLVEILHQIGCRIHIGTATMPKVLYEKILSVLGGDIMKVKLNEEELDNFDRHVTKKIDTFQDAFSVVNEAIKRQEKVLVVCNRVAKAQNVFEDLQKQFPNVPILLLHSRFKRGERNEKEKELIGLNSKGKPTGRFNTSEEACIVVSTQIVEVSLDISFDLMITETAPIDALIQRLGRVNRKRSLLTIGQTKEVYVIKPPESKKDASPYDPEVLKRSFDILPDGQVLKEKELQRKIDYVFPEIDFLNIEEHAVFKSDGKLTIGCLTHKSKSILFELLDIDSASCICEGDLAEYENSNFERRLELEIPVRYFSVRSMRQAQKGNKPFIIPDKAYSEELGLDIQKISVNNFDVNNQLL